MVEVTGATGENGRKAAWFDKFVTFLCAGGLPHSYTAYAGLASSMTLDFKCILNPYMVYATDRDITDGVVSEALSLRMEKTLDVALELAAALRTAPTHRTGKFRPSRLGVQPVRGLHQRPDNAAGGTQKCSGLANRGQADVLRQHLPRCVFRQAVR
jgi:hypothetical protein